MGIFESLFIGISIAAIPGPVFFELARRTLIKGFWSGTLINIGQFLANIVLLVLIFFGVDPFLTSTASKAILYLIGSSILIWLSISAFRLKSKDIEESYNKKIAYNNSFFAGFGIAIANPIVIAFWISLSGSYFMQFNSKYIAFINIISTAFGFVVFYTLLTAIVHFTKHKIPPKYIILLSRIFGIVLIVYGISFLYKLANLLLA